VLSTEGTSKTSEDRSKDLQRPVKAGSLWQGCFKATGKKCTQNVQARPKSASGPKGRSYGRTALQNDHPSDQIGRGSWRRVQHNSCDLGGRDAKKKHLSPEGTPTGQSCQKSKREKQRSDTSISHRNTAAFRLDRWLGGHNRRKNPKNCVGTSRKQKPD